MAATALLKLAGFTNEFSYVDIAHRALADIHSKPREIAIVGEPEAADTRALLSIVRDGYRPFQVMALDVPDGGCAVDGIRSIAAVPLLEGLGLVERQAAAHASPAPEYGRGFWFSALNCPFLTLHHSFYPGLDKLWQSWYNSRCTGMQDWLCCIVPGSRAYVETSLLSMGLRRLPLSSLIRQASCEFPAEPWIPAVFRREWRRAFRAHSCDPGITLR